MWSAPSASEAKKTLLRSLPTHKLRLLLALTFASLPISAAEQWIKLTSPHFEMYTTESKAKAVDALRTFEEARDFFAQKSPEKYAPDVAVEIIAFKSEKQYKPYRVNAASVAYYQRGHKCDYIVMQQLGREFLPAAIHEYTHLFIENIDLHLPLWLNEGLADVYSTLEPKDGKLMLGAPPRARLEAIRVMGPLDVRVLLSATRDSPYYTRREQMAQFYATSWELAHMLLLSHNYRRDFPQFLQQVSDGKPPEQALAETYHKTLDDVNLDLRAYLASGSITVSLFDLHLDEKQLEPQVSNPPSLETELVLADLLSTHPETADQARAKLNHLASELPASPDVEESLAYLAWQQGRLADAKQHFQAALAKGSKSANLLYNYSGLLHTMNAPLPEIIKVLQQAVAWKPDFSNARFRLGMEAVREGDCSTAIDALTGIKTVTPDHASPTFSAEAFCYWRLGNLSEARRLAEMAKQSARAQEEARRAQNLLDQLNRANPPN